MKRIRKKLIASMLLLLVLFTGAFIYVNRSLRPVLEGPVLQILSREDNTGDLITIHEANGAVYYLEADSSKLNTLAADCAICAQEKIASLGEQGVSIPIGTVSGIPLFTGMGPNLVMKFTPAGAVQSTFSSKFTSAGINQTLHRITLTLKATVRIILPGDAYIVSIETQAPISESISRSYVVRS